MTESKSPTIKYPPRRIYSKDLFLDWEFQLENDKNCSLDKKWIEKAEQELNETIELKNSCTKQLRHMLSISPDISAQGRHDDAFLLRFLRAKKFDTEKAFKMILKYYAMKEQSPELFKVSPTAELRGLLEMQIQYMVPRRDANGRQLYIFRVEKLDPYRCPVETVFRTNVLALENAVREPETQIAGLIVLLDMSGAGFGHAKFLAPYLSRKTVEVIQEAFPMRFKAFHILHEPFYFDAILSVLKPFLKEKIRKRIHLHGNSLSSLHNHLAKDILPLEYGGELPSFDNIEWRTQLLQDEDYFQKLETFIPKESPMLEKNNAEKCLRNEVLTRIPSTNSSVDTDDECYYEMCENSSTLDHHVIENGGKNSIFETRNLVNDVT